MEASNTIFNKEQLSAINNSMPADAKYGDVFAEIAKQQDEVSFKAGIKEVVEWINKYIADPFPYAKEEWQSKLKEWGIS